MINLLYVKLMSLHISCIWNNLLQFTSKPGMNVSLLSFARKLSSNAQVEPHHAQLTPCMIDQEVDKECTDKNLHSIGITLL